MIKNNLSKLMGAKRINISELVRLTGIHRSTLTRIYYEKTGNISFDTLDKLCIALECNTQELFEFIEV